MCVMVYPSGVSECRMRSVRAMYSSVLQLENIVMSKPYTPHSNERIVYDGVDACPYLEGERQRTPLRYQFIDMSPSSFG